MHGTIDFKGIAAAALACARSLLPDLVPGGRFEGDEYVALNPSRADKNLGSFKINVRTGMWQDFAIGVKGNDIIGWYAHAYGCDQGEAARRIAEKLGTSTQRSNSSKSDTKPPPKVHKWGEEGPPVRHNELRRHYYPKRGEPKLKVKVKKGDGAWTTCYRVLENDKPVGWQYEKPCGFRVTPYFGEVRDPKLIFWTEGEKDVDTLDELKLPVFTFGGTGDGLPDGVDRYLKMLTGRLVIHPVERMRRKRPSARTPAASNGSASSILQRCGRTAPTAATSPTGSRRAVARARS
jgi:putative DNA primase/helicase